MELTAKILKGRIIVPIILLCILVNLFLDFGKGSVASMVYASAIRGDPAPLSRTSNVDNLMDKFEQGRIFLEFEGFDIKRLDTLSFVPLIYYRSTYRYFPGEIHTGDPGLVINRGTEFLGNTFKPDNEWLKSNNFNYSVKITCSGDGNIFMGAREISKADPPPKISSGYLNHFFLAAFTLIFFILLLYVVLIPFKKNPGLFRLELAGRDIPSIFSMAVIIAMFAVVCGDSLLMPLYEWDSFAIWGLKAKVLFFEGFNSGYFTNPNLGYSHLDYPLLVPYLMGGVYAMIGHVDEAAGKIIYPIFHLAFICLIYTSARWKLEQRHSLLLTALFASTPSLVKYSGIGTADMVLTFFYAGSIFHLIRYFETEDRYDLILTGMFSACCILTKNEGLPVALINIAVFLVMGIARKKNIRPFLILLLVSFAPCIPWFIFSMHIPRIHENYWASLSYGNFMEHIDRAYVLVLAFSKEMMRISHWGLLWILLLGSLIFSGNILKNRPMSILMLLFILHVLLYFSVYIIYPHSVEWLLLTTIDRIVLHLTPPAVLLMVLSISKFQGRNLV